MPETTERPAIDYGTVWVNRGRYNIVATVNAMHADGSIELMTSAPGLVAVTVDELHADWESATVLTPVGSKWTTSLVYMPSVVVEVNHAAGECLRRSIEDPEDECWDECWKVYKYFDRLIGGRTSRGAR